MIVRCKECNNKEYINDSYSYEITTRCEKCSIFKNTKSDLISFVKVLDKINEDENVIQ